MPSPPNPPNPKNLLDPLTTVFVYGTLMPNERNAHVAQLGGPFSAQTATLYRFRLLHLVPEAYPALLPADSHSSVQGYALTYSAQNWETALPFLDELEGINETPPLYTRQKVVLQLQSGKTTPAWVYVYANTDRLNRAGVIEVPSGNWRDTLKVTTQGGLKDGMSGIPENRLLMPFQTELFCLRTHEV